MIAFNKINKDNKNGTTCVLSIHASIGQFTIIFYFLLFN